MIQFAILRIVQSFGRYLMPGRFFQCYIKSQHQINVFRILFLHKKISKCMRRNRKLFFSNERNILLTDRVVIDDYYIQYSMNSFKATNQQRQWVQHLPSQEQSESQTFVRRPAAYRRRYLCAAALVIVMAAIALSLRYESRPPPVADSSQQIISCFLGFPQFHQDIMVPLSQRQVLVNTRYPPVKMIVDALDKTVSSSIMGIGTWQPVSLKTFQRLVKKGDTILNIGSHVGLEAVVLGTQAGKTGRLFIFQPYYGSRNILKKNICINDLEAQTTVYPVAATNKKSKQKMLIWLENTGGAFLSSDKNEKSTKLPPNQQIQIQTDLVDNVIPQDVQVDFALIDVQRSQLECLEGMKGLMARSPNLIMVIEWAGRGVFMTPDQYNVKRDEIFNWLIEHNFGFYRIGRSTLGGQAIPLTCQKQPFIEMDLAELKDIEQKLLLKGQIIDIVIASKHIDLNLL